MAPALVRQQLTRAVSPQNLFGASFFCLFVAVSLGVKPIAAGHVFLFLALAAASVQRGRKAFEFANFPSSAWSLAAFVGLSILSVPTNLDVIESPVETLGKIRFPFMALVLLAMPWVVMKPLSEFWRRDALAIAWLVPLVLSIALGVFSWFTGNYFTGSGEVADSARVSGVYSQPMTYAYSLQFSFVLLAAFFAAPEAWRAATRLPRWAALASWLLSGGALYLTYTRGALLGAIAGLATIALLRSWKLCVALLLVGVAAGAVARFDGARYFSADSDIRFGQWRAAALSTLERPLFGLGYRNFEVHSAALKERYGFEKDVIRQRGKPKRIGYFQGHAHNNYLEAFASTGVLGGLAFLSFCLFWLRESLRSKHRLVFAPLVMTFLVSGVFENTFFDSEVLNCILLIWLVFHWVDSGTAKRGQPMKRIEDGEEGLGEFKGSRGGVGS